MDVRKRSTAARLPRGDGVWETFGTFAGTPVPGRLYSASAGASKHADGRAKGDPTLWWWRSCEQWGNGGALDLAASAQVQARLKPRVCNLPLRCSRATSTGGFERGSAHSRCGPSQVSQ